jgi:hypothetical protein
MRPDAKTFAFLLLLGAPAAAQDFGTEWLDQVVHDRMPAKGPLPTRPFQHRLHLGALAYYDTNPLLMEEDEVGEAVIVPFLRVRMDYSEKQLDVAADLLGAWKFYEPDSDLGGDEERIYARIRYVSPRVTLQAEEIFMHVSDPLDGVFPDRAERLTSNTVLRGQAALFGNVSLEANVNAGFVSFLDGGFEELEHWSLRPDLGVSARISNAIEGLVQGGLMMIDYSDDPAAAPDADGWFARAGIRGDLSDGVWVTALAGVGSAKSDDFSSGAPGAEHTTLDAVFLLRWQAAEKVVVTADYTRQFGFGGGGEPFVVVNRFVALLEYQPSEEWTWLLRGQYDFLDGALGSEREWFSFGTSLKWQGHPQVYLDGGATLRILSNGGSSPDFEADDFILHFGIVAIN